MQLVVRQYSARRANHVANASPTERSVGPATTFTTRLHTELRLLTAYGHVRADKLISYCRRSRRAFGAHEIKPARLPRGWLQRQGAAASHGRCSCALLYLPEGDFGRDARRATTAGANAPNRNSAREGGARRIN